jgi:hypothetical protein
MIIEFKITELSVPAVILCLCSAMKGWHTFLDASHVTKDIISERIL